MTISNSEYLGELLNRLKQAREERGLSVSEVEKSLIVGPGWVSAVERGDIHPSLDFVTSMISVYGMTLADLAKGVEGGVPSISRTIQAVQADGGIDIHFDYAKYDAVYHLADASIEQYNEVILTMRNGLAQLSAENLSTEIEKSIKTESVANAFLKAVNLWPHANPSDIWWFLIYRAYCDQYNHPSEHCRLDFTQSWKRTGGWALERILERHYGPALAAKGVNLIIADGAQKTRLLKGFELNGHRIEADKIDIALTIGTGSKEKLIGVVHVKASFAERRTDDVPMSQAFVEAGYISPLWTMDCKSTPSAQPKNRGELGKPYKGSGPDSRSAKRRDIEDDAYFSACFSYNRNTAPTPADFVDAKAKVRVCDFSNPEDAFLEFIVSESDRFK
ncbi:helix-turn-helix domain-containing protein [Oceanicaulis sp. LC35]|uniref:helix-turn-helix domain-containing protein n=1 Tax=Oceanicaulis sp. LC35 TaxID=3349635 RepID=UPI003F862598